MSKDEGLLFDDTDAVKRSASTRLGNDPLTSDPITSALAIPRTHEEKVELYLKTIAWFTGIIAAAVIVNVIAAIAMGAAAAGHSIGY